MRRGPDSPGGPRSKVARARQRPWSGWACKDPAPVGRQRVPPITLPLESVPHRFPLSPRPQLPQAPQGTTAPPPSPGLGGRQAGLPSRHAAYPARRGGAGALLELGVRGEALPNDVRSVVLGSQPRAAFEDKIDKEKLDSGVEAWGANEVPSQQDPEPRPSSQHAVPALPGGPSAPWRASWGPNAGWWPWEGDTQGREGTPAEREASAGYRYLKPRDGSGQTINCP